jgi:VWFA-related protein
MILAPRTALLATGVVNTTPSTRMILAPRTALLAALALATAVGAADPPRRQLGVAIEVRDATGAAPATLAPGDLEVALAGAPATVTAVEPITAGGWSVLVYVDALAASRGELENAAAALEAVSPSLAALGPVTVVVVDTVAEPWVEDSRDADQLRDAFAELAASSFEAPDPRRRAATRRGLLLDVMARRTAPAGGGPRVALLVGDANRERIAGSDAFGGEAAARGELAVAVAALGWVVLPLHLEGGVAVSPLAEETGGEVVHGADALAPALERLAARRRVRIESPAGPVAADGAGSASAIAPLSIGAAAGWSVRAPRWLATATPDFLLLARLHGLEADGESGELAVEVAAVLDAGAAGEPLVAVEALTEAGSASSSSGLRASIVLARPDEPPVVVHHRGSGLALDDATGWLLQARLDAPEDLGGVAVVVEELATGRWGAAIAELDGEPLEVEEGAVRVEVADLRRAPSAASGAPGAEPSLLRLVPPRARDLSGVQTFRAMSLNAFVRKVVFFLDGKEAATDGDEPFTARLDLGPDAREREIRAVAFDRGGRRLGEDAVVVNRPRAAFDVDIVEVRGRGPLEVTARVTAPAARRIARVELYWNETLATTLTAPPWSAKLAVEPSAGGDYVRAVAHLDDGASLEDVHLVGMAGTGEEVEVNLVEIFAVALDRDGVPLRDLTPGEVEVRLGGDRVEVERFGLAEDLPLDLGLVIDTSQSMEVLMDDARAAAVRFLADIVRRGDRAFLVDFDTQPRLAQAMTSEVADLMRALSTLRAGGNTALYDSILFAMLHFDEGEDGAAGGGGRRAVVLLTDGDDYQSRFSARQAWLQARATGVPVYLISLAGIDWMRPSMKKTDLEAIAKETGGHVFYVSKREELSGAYSRIGAELRSQYVLAFPTERELTEAELGKIDVRVSRPGVTVRAVVAGRSIQTR